MLEKLEKIYDNQVEKLPENEQVFFMKLKLGITKGYPMIKGILIFIGLFIIFTRIKGRLGLEETVFIILIIQMWYLRLINQKLSR
jgi:hypothetical protein